MNVSLCGATDVTHINVQILSDVIGIITLILVKMIVTLVGGIPLIGGRHIMVDGVADGVADGDDMVDGKAV
jgi:hypothetical protein